MTGNSLTPTLSPNGERERTEFAAMLRALMPALLLSVLLLAAIAYEDDEAFARFLAAESVKWKQALSSLDLRQ
jgi:hypothetical protein